MIFQRKKVASALAYVLGVGGAATLIAGPAQAADIRVEVTGSNIKRIEGEGALPVQIITREDIAREGIQTAMGIVERLSANSSIGGLNLQGGEGASNVGFATASLRGLGQQRTLVLMNGRRLANTSFSGTAVDINSIPLSAIERVEVLTDGASAIYGTDAIAGVINFIMRKDYTGFEASAYYGDSEHGGGSVQRYNGTAGWGDLTKDKFNLFATVDYNKIDNITAKQRPFSSTAFQPGAPGGVWDRTSGNSFPGNAFVNSLGITASPAARACLPPFSFPTNAAAVTQCRFDYASVIDIVPPSQSWNVYGSARWQFAPDHQAFLEAAWSQTTSTLRVSPAPISSATVLDRVSIISNPSSPYYPHAFAQSLGVDGEPLEAFWRGLELGPRTDYNTIQQTRIVGGLQGLIGGWDYTLDVNWSQSKSKDEWKAGWVSESVLFPILNSGLINLFGVNTPQQIALMQPGLILGKVADATGTMTDVNGKVSKDIYQLPAGPMALATGIEFRREQYQYNAGPNYNTGDIIGFGGKVESIPEQSRNVWAIYGELNIPIVKSLEATVALRYDDYQNVTDGRTWNPKVSARWQPSKEVLLRAAAGTGFRAPSLQELNQRQFTATGGTYDDPLRCPETQSPLDCGAQFFARQFGTQLKPETSQQWTAGFVWEPVPQFSFGADYFWIKVKNIIGTPPEFPIFSDMIASEAAGTLVRFTPGSSGCPPSATAGGIPCPVDFGNEDLTNLTQITTSGVDFNSNFRFPKADWGQLTFAFQGTYTIKWDQQSQGQGVDHLIGTYAGGFAATVVSAGSTGAFPTWKHNLLFGWTLGPWSANLTQTYVNSYTEPCYNPRTGVDCPSGPTRQVSPWSVWGLNGAYTGFKNWTFSVGVKNLLDSAPPYTRQNQAFQVGYDPAIADPTGRFYWGSIKYAFK